MADTEIKGATEGHFAVVYGPGDASVMLDIRGEGLDAKDRIAMISFTPDKAEALADALRAAAARAREE